jgi:hypothetical protein
MTFVGRDVLSCSVTINASQPLSITYGRRLESVASRMSAKAGQLASRAFRERTIAKNVAFGR